jgi:dTDP-4-dehydrorhamnose reductase
MSQPTILITGAHGQLGQELQVWSAAYPAYRFVFTDRDDMPIDDEATVGRYFAEFRPAWCINCAAYTAVDQAETDRETAFRINAEGVRVLASACKANNTRFVHISTDYVFDGQSPVPYKEESPTGPLNQYGASKLKGEQYCQEIQPDYIIIRTAWVYSSFGKNFVKTMMKLMQERPSINVVNDQVGSPTYAADLAQGILHIIAGCDLDMIQWQPGIYHYSNHGRISWYEFAEAIKEITNSNCVVNPVPTSAYPTPARRPAFSLLDTHKIQTVFHCNIPFWKDALQRCIAVLQKA